MQAPLPCHHACLPLVTRIIQNTMHNDPRQQREWLSPSSNLEGETATLLARSFAAVAVGGYNKMHTRQTREWAHGRLLLRRSERGGGSDGDG